MRWVLEVGFIALSTSWKWLLGAVVGVGALVGVLFGVGVIGGGGPDEPAPQVVAPTPIPTPQPTFTPRPPATPLPTKALAPTATATATPNLPSTVTMQVLAVEANNIGSLEFVLVYDTNAWELSKVEAGSLTSTALVDTHFPSPGRLWAGIIDPEGITGDGPLVVLTFNRLGSGNGPVPVTLEAVSAYDADTLVDVITDTTPGQLTTSASISPILTFH